MVERIIEAPQRSMAEDLEHARALGWAAAELVGRYRHGIHPRNPQAKVQIAGRDLPRLSFSAQKELKDNNSLMWLLAHRILVLADVLELDDLDDTEGEHDLDGRLRALPEEIRQYVDPTQTTDALDPGRFYSLMQDWTQLVRVQLGVRSQVLRDHFTFGGDMADLYWTLPVPQRHNLSEWQAAWRELLFKLHAGPVSLTNVAGTLPPFVTAALQSGVGEWQHARPTWLRDRVTFERARELNSRFSRQSQVWGNVLQGELRPEGFLTQRDRTVVAALSGGILGLGLLAVGAAAALIGMYAVNFTLGTLLPALPDMIEKPSLGEIVALVGTVGGALSFSVAIAWRVATNLDDAYRWLKSLMIPFFLRRRTRVPWRGDQTPGRRTV